jgi:hypothetical protein
LGSIDGVYATTSAWRDGLEVVNILFDPHEVQYETLLNKAMQFKCASKVFAHTKSQLSTAKELVGNKAVMAKDSQNPRLAKSSDQKYYLANSPLRILPMCDLQVTKINAAIGLKQPFENLLSPRQSELLKKILAKYKSDKSSLKSFTTPINDNQLGAYAAKLADALEE